MPRAPKQAKPQPVSNRLRVDFPDGSHTYLPRMRGLGDSYGQYEAFKPARYEKPEQRGFFSSVTRLWQRFTRRPNPDETSQQGAPGSASPSLYKMTLLQERYERREMMQELWGMVLDETRTRRATIKYAREATRDGCRITINDEKNEGVSDEVLSVAKESAERISAIVNKKAFGWAWAFHVEGDLFLQAIVHQKRVIDAKRMPASSMERITDDADEFIDPLAAFAQLDVLTSETIATFPLWMIHHERWCWVDGERYGQSELLACRRLRRLVELQEEAQAVRRMTRATKRTHWKIGVEGDNTDPGAIDKFKAINGFIEGKREIFDPNEIARDYFGDGNTKMESEAADTGVSDVEDLRYIQDVYTNTGLPTPAVIYNLDSQSVNRDVTEDVRTEWNKDTKELSNALANAVNYLFELDLLLQGIPIGMISYETQWSESSVERPGDIVDYVTKLRANATADYKPDPLVSRRTAITKVAHILGIKDVDAEINALDEEQKEREAHDVELMQRQQDIQLEGMKAQAEAFPESAPASSGGGSGPPKRGQNTAAKDEILRDIRALSERIARNGFH